MIKQHMVSFVQIVKLDLIAVLFDMGANRTGTAR